MQIAPHIYSTHIEEDPSTFGAMHPGGTQIYFVGDPSERMVVVDSGEPYRSWKRQILDYHTELGRPRISAILITHGHGDHIGGLDRLQESFDCEVRCHPKLEPRLTHQLGRSIVRELAEQETVDTGGGGVATGLAHAGPRGRPYRLPPARRWCGVQRRHHPRKLVLQRAQPEAVHGIAGNAGAAEPRHPLPRPWAGHPRRRGQGRLVRPPPQRGGRSRCWRRWRRVRSRWTKS